MDLLEGKIGYKFKNKQLLKNALVHSSYANENNMDKSFCNERLEFLGDSVLSAIISRYLFETCRNVGEGTLSKLRASIVCEAALGKMAEKIELGSFLYLGKGEEQTGGRERYSVLSDAFEALIAAVYLDSDIKTTTDWLLNIMMNLINDAVSGKAVKDYKTTLQERLQRHPSDDICYKLISESGPEHNKLFEVEVSFNKKSLAKGKGRSKKAAEQDAAMHALKVLDNE